MATLGQALAHQQALWVGLALGFAWLIANAELVPGAMAPALLAVRRPIAGACNALLSGWWPVVAGKLLLVSMALYVVRQLVYMRLDRMQARAEEEQQKALELSLRRAREEAQRKLQILAEEQQREEERAMAVAQALRERGGHEGDANREEGVAHARDRAQGQLQALAGQKAPTQQVIQTSSVKGHVSGQAQRPDRAERQQQWVQGVQQQVDEASVRAAQAAAADAHLLAAVAAEGGSRSGSGTAAAAAPAPAPLARESPAAAAAHARALSSVAPVGSASNTGAVRHSTSFSSLSRAHGSRSSGNMIPLAVAQEAEQRQQQWLQQLQDGLNPGEAARRVAIETDRLLREEQDREYLQAMEADRLRAQQVEDAKRAAAELAEAQRREQEEAQARKQELQRKREEERAVLAGTEPAPGTEGAVLVRVRLPTGSSKQRWFMSDSHMADVSRWVCCLEEMPLTGETWKLNSYPRVVLEGTRTLSDVAAGASAVALFVEAA